ncbi:sarcosine oxidase subunit delta [Tersicoccus phoenicis]|uniref:Sarcosine oxidase subunit delta n=1 Tax=Tersicoccus phoenicis TaxID=554083 RepID=A0A1R1L6D7_9MICC|nr:sarcosine oxidase subunit delta [Tersicoccus phoenicis]OMH23115.1 sarcosine oxidase subunit delta [Tersicoccus phoenicis]
MLIIDCPWCGPRQETEFGYGGQAHVAYPEDPYALDDAAWAEYLFYRDNPKGVHAERWVHSVGCRRWFNALRDTHTYDVLAVYRMGEPRPDVASPHTPQDSELVQSTVVPGTPESPAPGSTTSGTGNHP